MMSKIFLIFLLFPVFFCKEENEEPSISTYIVFSNEKIKISEGSGATVSGTTVLIEKPGVYLVSGESEEGNIVIKESSVTIYLQNLKLFSQKTAPIIVTNNLKDIKIINLKNTILKDLEDSSTTEGECAVVKIKKNSIVYFGNNDIFTLYGECKNIIRGGSQVSVIFEKSEGEYIINGNKNAISVDGSIEFNGGTFTVVIDYGDAIKSSPDDQDIDSLGKILINDGTFNIQCFNDAFTAKNNITIVKGKFDIKTENGYDSDTYNETESSKGFKLTNDAEGSEIKIYSGDFYLNTADDAFRSNRDITILSGKFTIYSKDDAICAKFNLVMGVKNSHLDDLNIKIFHSYEAIEGMTVTIYSGKIIVHAEDDGINASGVVKKQRNRRPRNRNHTNNTNDTHIWNNTERQQRNNRSRDDQPWTTPTKHVGAPGNDSYCIRIYNAEIYIFTDSDGIDSNGNLYIHGGNINIFSEGKGANEPIDHNGNFTLFNAEILGVGTGGLEFVHEGIKKGNQMYAFYSGVIPKNKVLEIKNEKKEIVKQGSITKDINYIFYTSEKLNEDYRFYIFDEEKNNKTELNVTYNFPENGLDDEDEKYSIDEENSNNNDNNKGTNSGEKNEQDKNINDVKNKNSSNNLRSIFLCVIILLILV